MPVSQLYAHEQRSRWLHEFPSEHELTVSVIASCPADKLGWKPHELSMPFAEMALHLYFAGTWFLKLLQGDESITAEPPEFEIPGDTDGLVQQCDAFFSEFFEGLRNLSVTQLASDVELLDFGLFPGVKIIELHHGHWIHHRAQLQLYLRIMGERCTPIYGPTAEVSIEELLRPDAHESSEKDE